MKVLLIGNYAGNHQQSMDRFAALMHAELSARGCQVRLVRPPVLLGQLRRAATKKSKWCGYVDQFVVYPFRLRRQVKWADVVHICDQANAVYIPYLQGVPHVLTCHDLLAVRAALGEIGEWRPSWTGRLYQRWILHSLGKADAIACVSGETYAGVRRLTRVREGKVALVPNSLNYSYRPMEVSVAKEHLRLLGLDCAQPFFIHVGGNSWYKNRAGVIRLFAELVKHSAFQSHHLVLAGEASTPQMRQLSIELGVGPRVVDRENVSNECLRALYSSAEALLFPSLQEGFGWPILEAQACGCAVVTTDRAPMNEIGGDAAIYIDPAKPAEAAAIVVAGLRTVSERRISGLRNVARYPREEMIGGYLKCYREVLEQRRAVTANGGRVNSP